MLSHITVTEEVDVVADNYYKPSLVFPDMLGMGIKNIAEAISHEAGHSLGLSHDGTASTGYYQVCVCVCTYMYT